MLRVINEIQAVFNRISAHVDDDDGDGESGIDLGKSTFLHMIDPNFGET